MHIDCACMAIARAFHLLSLLLLLLVAQIERRTVERSATPPSRPKVDLADLCPSSFALALEIIPVAWSPKADFSEVGV